MSKPGASAMRQTSNGRRLIDGMFTTAAVSILCPVGTMVQQVEDGFQPQLPAPSAALRPWAVDSTVAQQCGMLPPGATASR